MDTWTNGYVTDIGYTYGYYNELNPIRVRLAFLNAGLAPPNLGGVHCELGFGQGLSINIHAAASATSWYGNDFNPSQAAFAQTLARASGADIQLTDQSFLEFCSRTDLPDFDSIGLHGIWTWISNENRSIIVDFIKRKLKVGGFIYISYNTYPGWSNFAPVRHLMAQHSQTMGSDGEGVINRVQNSITFAEKVIISNPKFAIDNPQSLFRFNQIKDQNSQYLAHEYFNRDWDPMYFSDISNWLEPAKLNFACSAHYLDHIDPINLTSEQQALLKGISNLNLKESVRDFLVNQQFRRDYWIKGPIELSAFQQSKLLRDESVILVSNPDDVALKINGALGEAALDQSIYLPLLSALASHEPQTIGSLESKLKTQNIAINQLFQSVMVLSGVGHVLSTQSQEQTLNASKSTIKLNNFLFQLAKGSGNVGFLASPVSAGGFNVSRFEHLFLLAISEGKLKPEEWAQFALSVITSQGQKLVKDGKAIETEEESLLQLITQASEFERKRLPILKALEIVNR